MDHQYDRDINGSFASEMSNEYKYTIPECQNTHHYLFYFRSCWDVFEDMFDKVGLTVETIKFSEGATLFSSHSDFLWIDNIRLEPYPVEIDGRNFSAGGSGVQKDLFR